MYDVIVVGAGPAGTSAARICARAGLDTLIIEKEKLPRDKLCGGGLTPKAIAELGDGLPPGIIERICRSARVYFGDRVYRFESARPLVYMTSRKVFDKYMADLAVGEGASLMDSAIVRAVRLEGNGVRVLTDDGIYKARLVIGADGANGIVARSARLGNSWSPSAFALALEVELSMSSGEVKRFMGRSDSFDLYFDCSPAGYGWAFPKRRSLTVGVGCIMSHLPNSRELFDMLRRKVRDILRADLPEPKAHLIPIGGSSRQRCHGERILLAGDAAGFVEPLLGEGIYFAIRSGKLAGLAALRAFRRGDFSERTLRWYDRACSKDFGADLRIAYEVARALYCGNQAAVDRFLRFLFKDPRVRSIMLALIIGEMRYRQARIKLLYPYMRYRLERLIGLDLADRRGPAQVRRLPFL